MGNMKVVEGDFSGLEILFFLAVRRAGGLGVMLYPGQQFKGEGGLVLFPPPSPWRVSEWSSDRHKIVQEYLSHQCCFFGAFFLECGFPDPNNYSLR